MLFRLFTGSIIKGLEVIRVPLNAHRVDMKETLEQILILFEKEGIVGRLVDLSI